MSHISIALGVEADRLHWEAALREKHSVQTFRDGLDAYRAAQHDQPDLILLDDFLPTLGGLALARLLKFHQTTRQIQVVFLHGHQEESSVAAACGVDLCLSRELPYQQAWEALSAILPPT